jgi:hypothetical protein
MDALERELLILLSYRPLPAMLRDVFEGLRPRWAIATAERLIDKRQLCVSDGGLSLTQAGRIRVTAAWGRC